MFTVNLYYTGKTALRAVLPRKWRAAAPPPRYAASLTVKAERFTSESVPERDKEFLK